MYYNLKHGKNHNVGKNNFPAIMILTLAVTQQNAIIDVLFDLWFP